MWPRKTTIRGLCFAIYHVFTRHHIYPGTLKKINPGQKSVRATGLSAPSPPWSLTTLASWGPFLESPELFGSTSGDIILFASSKRRRLEARNFAVILIFIPLTTYEKTISTE